MKDDDLTALCRSCGLCCDGSLFGRVPLAPPEVPDAYKHGLRVIPSGTAFEQPCTNLTRSRACTSYVDRPRACRSFTCHLYERHRRLGGPLGPRLESVRRVRQLLAIVARTKGDGSAREELMRRLEEDFGRA